MSGYQDYLESGVVWLGAVPRHWRPLRFKHVLEEKRRVANPRLDAGSISFGTVVYKNSETLAPETKASYQEVLPGEFLINPLNLNFDLKSLRTALSSISVVVSTGYIVLRSHPRLDKRYVRWLLQEFDVAHMKTLGSGVRQTINYTDIGNSVFFEPPIEEQAQIAKFLDYETAKIDALIDKQQQLIALLKEKRQAVISHAVTKGLNPDAPMKDSGVEWLGEVPAHWTATSLKHHSHIIDCKHVTAEFVNEGIPVASIAEVKGWEVDLATSKKTTAHFYELLIGGNRDPRPGDIFFTRNATVGEAALVPAEMPTFAMGQDVCLIRPLPTAKTEFVLHCLKSPLVARQLDLAMIGSTFKRVNVEEIRNLSLSLPPAGEQDAIVQHLESKLPRYDKLIEAAQATVDLMGERRTALISAAVTGKIDVRTWKVPADKEVA